MGVAKGKGKGPETEWTDLTGESDDEHTGLQLQVASQPIVYERASLPAEPNVGCVRA